MPDLELTYERVRFWAGWVASPRSGKSYFPRYATLLVNIYSWGLPRA